MKGKTVPSDENISVISAGVTIEGKLSSSGHIRVDGIVKGDVTAAGNVTFGESSDINGEVKAENITIGGKVTGTIRAKEKLILESNCALRGDIFTKILVIEAGAYFEGKSSMGNSTAQTIPLSSNS